jgi:pyridoxal phosphate enzyme (YggS family)
MWDAAAQYARVKGLIESISRQAGRDLNEITIVLVAKNQPTEKIAQVIHAGAMDLAQNYPERMEALFEHLPDAKALNWHMIGHCQSRKAALVVKYFKSMHSLDSLELAERIARIAHTEGKVLPVMLEINLSGEMTKKGFRVTDEADYQQLLIIVDAIRRFPGLELAGLMTMPPFSNDPEISRPVFKKLKGLQQMINKDMGDERIRWLSMGTSQDYLVAIEEGSTHVRLGTCVFGERKL